MVYLGAWLLAVGVADLTRPAGAVGRAADLRRALLAGLATMTGTWLAVGAPVDARLLVWLALATLAACWVVASGRAIDSGRPGGLALPAEPAPAPGGRARRLAFAALAGGILLAVGANGIAPGPHGIVADWYAGLGIASLRGVPLAKALTVAGVVIAEVGTANIVVRLGLDTAGARSEPGVLRGGRLVGPLERLALLGLGMAGQPTAASLVIAAKSLIRFPELQKQGAAHQRIDIVTEYFVVGSLVSWVVAFAGIVLARA